MHYFRHFAIYPEPAVGPCLLLTRPRWRGRRRRALERSQTHIIHRLNREQAVRWHPTPAEQPAARAAAHRPLIPGRGRQGRTHHEPLREVVLERLPSRHPARPKRCGRSILPGCARDTRWSWHRCSQRGPQPAGPVQLGGKRHEQGQRRCIWDQRARPLASPRARFGTPSSRQAGRQDLHPQPVRLHPGYAARSGRPPGVAVGASPVSAGMGAGGPAPRDHDGSTGHNTDITTAHPEHG